MSGVFRPRARKSCLRSFDDQQAITVIAKLFITLSPEAKRKVAGALRTAASLDRFAVNDRFEVDITGGAGRVVPEPNFAVELDPNFRRRRRRASAGDGTTATAAGTASSTAGD
jgi:hypothetical protein